MDVSDDCDGCCDVYDVGLLHEEFFCFGAYCLDDGFGKKFLLVEPLDALVQINASYGLVSGLEIEEIRQISYWEGQACLVLGAVEELYPVDRGRFIFILVTAHCFKAKWVFDLRIIVQLVLAPKSAFHHLSNL